MQYAGQWRSFDQFTDTRDRFEFLDILFPNPQARFCIPHNMPTDVVREVNKLKASVSNSRQNSTTAFPTC